MLSIAGLVALSALAVSVSHAVALTVCHGFSCTFKTRLEFGSADLKSIAAIMRIGASSAKAERRAISRAVQYYERKATRAIGVKDRPKGDLGGSHERGQMDCVDESTNTTSLLKLLETRGLLKHHTVERKTSRGFFADGRYPHFTAVVADRTGEKWVVDSWFEPAGGAPDIMPLTRWRTRGVWGER
ncbi:hypothetical protein KEU06_13505 [Pseudaminobacter sp. 19-2017]|uniref:Uncharacterized protein n=1 Tax=Pseudaminobacter soli (ex Zhang et al. 2022) TaxID=2831468 RepID=A0A942I8R4_9HYPH|nr:hypothetical protein [Pseudaminobacter soli]MBS3649625.1 hypothetical protein [Pseudaminobacter soli]